MTSRADFDKLGNRERHLVPFDDLPDGGRRVWNRPAGSHEEGLGRLVLLTPEVVAAAAGECIRSGRRVGLNLNMNKLEHAQFGRHAPQHHIAPILGGLAFDDIYIFNPQQSSQWDGLRHHCGTGQRELVAARAEAIKSTEVEEEVGIDVEEKNKTAAESAPPLPEPYFYGGTTKAEIQDRSCERIGIQHWAREGICGRGVLLDYAAWADRQGIEYSAFDLHAVPLATLQEVAREANVKLRAGDILFIRMGVVREWEERMSPEQRAAYALSDSPCHAGIEGTEEMLRWLWDGGVAAVASDAISVEVFPDQKSYPRPGSTPATVPGLSMHSYLLAGWGMPIGELFDLEALSRMCAEEGRWTFFVASAPLNMPGGVSSPPNCVAIF